MPGSTVARARTDRVGDRAVVAGHSRGEAESRCNAPLVEIYGIDRDGPDREPAHGGRPGWRLFPGVRLAPDDGRHRASGGHVEGEVPIDDVLELLDDGRFLLHGRSPTWSTSPASGARSAISIISCARCPASSMARSCCRMAERPTA
jgi:hypothetical protein